MFLKIIAATYLAMMVHGQEHRPHRAGVPSPCLTGTMADLQQWVDNDGLLIGLQGAQYGIDISQAESPTVVLEQRMSMFSSSGNRSVEYLSMARCDLHRVPPVFSLKDIYDRPLYETVRYLTLYGNQFQEVSVPGEHYDFELNATSAVVISNNIIIEDRTDQLAWAFGFRAVKFENLIELDLRQCNIEVLKTGIFSRMASLTALYLSDNIINHVDHGAFDGLDSLVHLDLSRNLLLQPSMAPQTISWQSADIFQSLPALASLDLSYSKLADGDFLQSLRENLQRLSLCYTGIQHLSGEVFKKTSLKILDVSGNKDILSDTKSLGGIEDSLEVLYADSIGLKSLDLLYNFQHLQLLRVSNNELAHVKTKTLRSLKSAQILDLESNRLSSWFSYQFSVMPKLILLNLRANDINMISEPMVKDMENISYIGMANNNYFCNCHSKEFIDVARTNEMRRDSESSFEYILDGLSPVYNFHNGFEYYTSIVKNRVPVVTKCTGDTCLSNKSQPDYLEEGNFVIFDYNQGEYNCFALEQGVTLEFNEVKPCGKDKKDVIEEIITESRAKLIALIVIPMVAIPLIGLGFFFRRNFRYFLITMRNSAMLSLMNKYNNNDDSVIYNYDVFVSYCNEDRHWVLDYLLPHMENDCNVRVCLHERDFQVGLSILDNIVSCMDRSRSIMLIMSQRFLQSQWCQFELHLAQHRLLETRREDLILVLLEEIPRRMRPNTLHYLMLTKTYIVWPKNQTDQSIFWKRVKKSLMTHRAGRNIETASFA